jgi:DNA repair protein RecO (recombination protein O)
MPEEPPGSGATALPANDIGRCPAITPITLGVRLDRSPQITAVEVRPQSIKEDQLGVRALPQQEVGRSLLPRRADEQIDIGDLRFVEKVPEALLGELARIKSSLSSQLCDAPRGVDDFGAAPVVHAELQGQDVVADGATFGVFQFADHTPPQPRRSAGPAHPDAHGIELVSPPSDHVAVEAHQPANLIRRAVPVLGGKGVRGEVPDSDLDGPLDHVEERSLTAGMALGPWQIPRLRPAAIAIHHDRDMGWQPFSGYLRRSSAACVGWRRSKLPDTRVVRPGVPLATLSRARRRPRKLGHVRDNIEVPTYRDEAVVLRTHKLGEADRIITLLSRRHGKIRAVAKGVRRTTSKFGARLEPFSHIDLQLAVGRSLDVITQVESLDAFGEPLTDNYPAYTAGQVMLETADRLVVEEAEPAVQQYLLLVGALRALNEGTSDGRRAPTLILDSYLLRALAMAGYAPSFFDCARCGLAGPHRAFSPALGGAVCERCRPAGAARPAPETLALLGALLEGRWRDTRQVTDQVAREASGITAAFLAWHLDRNLRSLAHVER